MIYACIAPVVHPLPMFSSIGQYAGASLVPGIICSSWMFFDESTSHAYH
jgi:hypothetical protein